MTHVVVHACCAPCLSGSREILEEEGYELTAFWFNPNVMPYREFVARLHELQRYAYLRPIPLALDRWYDPAQTLRALLSAEPPAPPPPWEASEGNGGDGPDIPVQRPDESPRTGGPSGEHGIPATGTVPSRCRACIALRLRRTALYAKAVSADGFTTTMLLSRYMPHDVITATGREVGKALNVPFIYRDLRRGWKRSLEVSAELELYRQPYCGCIFSEHERWAKK